MAAFIKLEDSPMFQKQVCNLEQTADELKERCQKLFKGCKKFMAALGEACNGDTTFADSLEAFGGDLDDPISVAIGGPVLSKFISAFRELATYKELLRTQVEHVLVNRLMHFMSVDLQDAKESRRRFDKAIHVYDQSREKFVSLKKNTRGDIVSELEEDLQNSKSAFEKGRFNLVNSLMNIEAKKKYEFLESISAIMDGHLRYFKLGYELLSQMEPYIHQVLTYAQQSKEQATVEQDKLHKRIQEFRTQAEMDSIRASSNFEASAVVEGHRAFGLASYKNVEPITFENGKPQTIKEGYLLKRSSNLRGDWKRRFFVLNSQGALFYYRIKGTKPMGSQAHHFTRSTEHNSGVFGRFRSKNRASSLNENILGCRTVDLCTSTIKMDAEDTDLRLCFRIISPSKTYTLQAENEADRMDWMNKITGAITSLLNFRLLEQPHPGNANLESCEFGVGDVCRVASCESLHNIQFNRVDCVSTALRGIPGNDLCAECSSPEPDWASLNLGILLCIECSGAHRNLGVHISKVRSITLDVKVWEPTIVDLFRNLGNAYCNSLWEGKLLLKNERLDGPNAIRASISKPCPQDAIQHKEIYIQAKYVEKVATFSLEIFSNPVTILRVYRPPSLPPSPTPPLQSRPPPSPLQSPSCSSLFSTYFTHLPFLYLSTPYCSYRLFINENSSHLHRLHPISTPYILHPYNPIMLFCHRFSTPLVQIYLRNCPCPLWMELVASASGFASFSTTAKRTYARWRIFVPHQRVARFLQSHFATLGVSWASLSPVCCVPTGVEGSKMVLWWLILFKQRHGGGGGSFLGMELLFSWWLLASISSRVFHFQLWAFKFYLGQAC